MTKDELVTAAREVLEKNDRGKHTVPAGGLYPHQWLWDSCFIAIGQRHYDDKRAQTEILSLLLGQWSNGMLPNMILTPGQNNRHSTSFWRSSISPYSPDKIATSGITQPPIIAEAVVRIGQKLSKSERRVWYQRVYPALLAYHTWLYADRDPHNEGLALQLHPWETGLDNTPPWMYEVHRHTMPYWIRLVRTLHIDSLITMLRRDRQYALPGERLSTIDALSLYSLQRRLRRNSYDTETILHHSDLAIEDLSFNSILIRNNHHLQAIAKFISKKVPKELAEHMKKTEEALESLWDAYSAQYYSRNFFTHKLIKVSSVATLLPLYAGSVTKERAAQLVEQLNDKKLYNTLFPIPSVPVNSSWFHPHLYWQGPTWVNINWLIIDGLEQYGYKKEADHIRSQTIKLVAENGPSEYFSPKDGSPAGAKNFSWTAALFIDLLHQ